MLNESRSLRNGSLPTILLVHGAFSDTSTWAGVIEATADLGSEVIAVGNPLRGLGSDAAYVAALAATIDGPVLLVGHGYGGAVITVAGAQAANVVGLVYVAAPMLDECERCIDLIAGNRDRRFIEALRPVRLQTAETSAIELFVRREAFAELFGADRSPQSNAVSAACQRPVAAAALEEAPKQVAWRDLPCWSVIPTGDLVLDVETQRAQAVRAQAVVAEVDASHLVTASQPEAVAKVLRSAARLAAGTRSVEGSIS